MESLITSLGNLGGMGVVAGILFWQMTKLQNKLIDIIEKNTQAFIELKETIEKLKT